MNNDSNTTKPSYPMAQGQVKHAPPLSMWRQLGDTIYVSGHGAVNSDGQFISEDFEEQYLYTMQQMQATMKDAGVDFSDVVSVRCYVQNPADLPIHNRLYRQFFSEPFPARTTIVNCLPPGLLFEIECVAQKADGD